MVIICGMSAWEYFCTPPIVRETELPIEIATRRPPFGAGIPKSLFSIRENASEASRLVQGRLLHDLKGISLPINVCSTDQSPSYRANRLVVYRRMPRYMPTHHLIKLNDYLYITSPELTLVHLAKDLSWQQLSLLMLEACGLFAVFRGTLRSKAVLNEVASYYKSQDYALVRAPIVSEYCDERGRRLHKAQYSSPIETWSPCFDRFGKMTELWKRPPLCTVESLERLVGSAEGSNGASTARKALRQVANGSGSPFEARLFLMLCSEALCGGEHWERPSLNRRVVFTPEAQNVSGQTHCACDFLWEDKNVVIEAKGKAYHADKDGFEIENGRRAALESMGYTTFDVIYSQVANLDQFDTLLHTFSKRLGFSLRKRTPTFLYHREALYRELFTREKKTISI